VGGYCDCWSGYGGNQCQNSPDVSCPGIATLDTTANFQPSITTWTFANQSITLIITANQYAHGNGSAPNSLSTSIYFGSSATPCDFPGPNWVETAAASGNCIDTYTGTFQWSTLKTSCNFVSGNGGLTYQNSITTSRNFSTSYGPVRTEADQVTLAVDFPTPFATTTTSVKSFGPVDVRASIIDVSFAFNSGSTTDGIWTIVVDTLVQYPFSLPYVNYTSPLPNSLPVPTVTQPSACVGNCEQTTTLAFSAPCGQTSTSSSPLTLQFWPACIGSVSDCPLRGGEYDTVELYFTTGSACPIASQVTATATLASFQDAALHISRDQFFNDQTVYFGITIISPNAIPVQADVLNVTVNGSGYTDYTSFGPTSGYHGGFSLPLTDAAFNIGSLDSESFVFGATILATFQGEKRSVVQLQLSTYDVASVITQMTPVTSQQTQKVAEIGASGAIIPASLLVIAGAIVSF
jgi:hypothetical protein